MKQLRVLALLVAILCCVWLTTVRWKRAGGDSDLVFRVTVWGVAFGVIGARAYHDITSWSEVPTPKWKGVFEVWRGGLGVWGGVLLGTVAGAIVEHAADANVGIGLASKRVQQRFGFSSAADQHDPANQPAVAGPAAHQRGQRETADA